MAKTNSRYMVEGTSALKAYRRSEGEYRPQVVCTRGRKSFSPRNQQDVQEPITYRRYVSECANEVKSAVSREAVADTRKCNLDASQLALIGVASFVFTLFATLI